MRVVSLVPSATETLLVWGVEPIACTRFCEQPHLRHVGGTKTPDVGAVVELAPDLVVMSHEENRREDADALTQAGLDIHVLHIESVADVMPELARLAQRLDVSFEPWTVPELPAEPHARAFVPIWRRPWMTVNGQTYGASVLAHLGVATVFADAPDRYPEVALEDVAALAPDVVLAPSEPYPFTERHVPELSAVAPVVLVDGKDLFWWGVRTPAALDRLRATLRSVPASGAVAKDPGTG